MLEYIVKANIVIVNCNLVQVGNVGSLVVADEAENLRHSYASWVVCGGPLLRCTRAANDKGDAATPGFEVCHIVKSGFSAQDAENMIGIGGARNVNILG